MTAAEIEALGGYYGATPRPDDFELLAGADGRG